LLQNFIEFESLCAGGRELEKADIRLQNKSALQSDPRGKHKTTPIQAVGDHLIV
jgi:hypothetical protein